MSDLIEKVKVADSRVAWNQPKTVSVLEGPMQTSWQVFQSQNTSSTSNQIYQINIPNESAISRLIYYNWQGTAVINGTISGGTATALSQLFNVGLSDNCASQVIALETIQVQNKSVSIQRSRSCVELSRVNVNSKTNTIFKSGSGGNMQDYACEFLPWANTIRYPLAGLYDTPVSDSCPSPRTIDIYITASNATTITVAFNVVFTSEVSPFANEADQGNALRNLNVIICQLQLESVLDRFFSFCNLGTVSGSTATLANPAVSNFTLTTSQVYCQFVTPHASTLAHYQPIDDVYKYCETNIWTIGGPAMSACPSANSQASVGTFNITQVTGNVIPSLVVIAARPLQSALANGGALSARRWFPPVNAGLQLYWNNVPVLNGISQYQMWQLSVANGLDCTYEQWVGRDVTSNSPTANPQTATGSQVLGGGFLVLNPAKDFNLVDGSLTNGVKAQFTLNGTVTCFNQSYTAYTAGNTELVIIMVYEGYLVSNGTVNTVLGTLTQEEARNIINSAVPPINDYTYDEMTHKNGKGYMGGGLFRKIGHHLKHGIIKGAKYLVEHPQYITKAVEAYKKYKSGSAILGGGSALDTSRRAIEDKRMFAKKTYNQIEESDSDEEY
jgi:hypothetical protein